MKTTSPAPHRRARRGFWCAVSLLLLCVGLPAHAETLRCGNRVVNDGDRDFAVRDRCGEPYYAEQFYAVDVHGARTEYETQDEIIYDAWYYNFGPRRFLVRLVFANGRLAKQESLGYGVNELGDDCDIDTLRSGTTGGEIVARCGLPASRNTHNRTVVRRDRRGNERLQEIHQDEWIYDIGPNHLIRVLNLENGELVGSDSERR